MEDALSSTALWVIAIGALLSYATWSSRQDKLRAERAREKTQVDISQLAERVTRVESEIVTEREVREVLHELIDPFATNLAKIEATNTQIASDLVDIKISLARAGNQ